MKEEDLIAAGYKEFEHVFWNVFRKDVKDSEGLKYYIDYGGFRDHFRVEFYDNEKPIAEILISMNDIAGVENVAEEMWKTIGKPYTERK